MGAGEEPQQPAVDPRRLLLFTSGGDGSRPPPSLATKPPEVPSCRAFLDGLRAGNYDRDEDKSTLEAIASTILVRGHRPEIRLKHKNRRARVYLRQRSLRKEEVKKSQTNKRRAAALRLQVGVRETGVARTRRARTRLSRGAVHLSVNEQVGLVAALSISHIALNRWRLALGGATSGLCSLRVLRALRRELSALPSKQVVVTGSGAHLASLAAAIQERVSSVCPRDLVS